MLTLAGTNATGKRCRTEMQLSWALKKASKSPMHIASVFLLLLLLQLPGYILFNSPVS